MAITKPKPSVRRKNRDHKTKNRKNELDLIQDNLKKDPSLIKEVIDEENGVKRFHCVPCDRFLIDLRSYESHKRGTDHKKRLKEIKEKPYSQDEADSAAGFGNYRQDGTTATTSST